MLNAESGKGADMEFSLSDKEKIILLKTARERIKADLRLGRAEYPEPTAKLKEICGAFVTLHNSGKLRGCIGNIVGRKPLIGTILNMAHAAAFEDPRFPKLTAEEWSSIEIEISVLSPLRQITDINEIKVGVHGIYLTLGYNAGVLLPQVATEQLWNRDQFITHTCLKAGLPENAWQNPSAVIEIFSAVVFSENELQD